MADNKFGDNAPKTDNVTESNDSVGESKAVAQAAATGEGSVGETRPESSDQAVAAKPKPPRAPQFGPGSKINWDNEAADPNRRKHVGIDPDGKHNAKTVFGNDQ